MKSFDIDLYLWLEGYDDWMFVPAAGSNMAWPRMGVTQSEILNGPAGVTFRIDGSLWLGDERDRFPLSILVWVLHGSLSPVEPGELRMHIANSEYRRTEVRQASSRDEVLVSRLSSRPVNDDDYLEKTAQHVGTYYKDVAVPAELWCSAVNRTLDGLARAVATSPPADLGEEKQLGDWLLGRLGRL